MKVSVVVPIYNSEKYIQKCIDSIINQKYSDWELILVDDGSTDNSISICKKNSEYDSRIHVLTQKNMGSNYARKVGTFASLGQYITYVDSDDYVDAYYILNLVMGIKNADLAIAGGLLKDKKITCGVKMGEYNVNSESPIIKGMFYNNKSEVGIKTAIWGNLYKTELAKGIFNKLDMNIYYGEDAEFVYKYILNCNSVNILDYCGYYYTENSNSISHILHQDFLINVNRLYLSLKEEFEKCKYREILMPQLKSWISEQIRLSYELLDFGYVPIRYIIPCKNVIANKNIIVYGAGKVGKDYIRQIVKENLCNSVIWVDRDYGNKENFLGMKVEPISRIKEVDSDYIIIAINNTKMLVDVKENIEKDGINSDKIISQKPMYIEDFYCSE